MHPSTLIARVRAGSAASLVLLEAAAGRELYHTTTFRAAQQILRSGALKPGGIDKPFVSFSERPIKAGDISGNDVVLVFSLPELASQVMKVEYTERWYDRYPEHAAYIAGEGWRDQYQPPDYLFEPPDDLDPEEALWWEPDEDDLAQEERYAELQSFLAKRDEREYISKHEHMPVKFPPRALLRVLAIDRSQVVALQRAYPHIRVGALRRCA